MTPAEELRAAANAERYVWTSTNELRPDPTAQAIHLALAELLEIIAYDMESSGAIAVTGLDRVAVHTSAQDEIGYECQDWTAALKVARAINGGGE